MSVLEGFFHDSSVCAIHAKSLRDSEMKQAYTEFLNPSLRYSISFILRKNKYNFVPDILPKTIITTKYAILQDFNVFITEIRRSLMMMMRLDQKKYGPRVYPVTHISVIFKPIHEYPRMITGVDKPSGGSDVSDKKLYYSNDNLVNRSYDDYSKFNRKIVYICDLYINQINSVLFKLSVRKHLPVKIIKILPFLGLNNLYLEKMLRALKRSKRVKKL